MHWTEEEIYKIAFITSRGWKYEDKDTWSKDGHTYTTRDDRCKEITSNTFTLDLAYWEEFIPDEKSSTIPAPPHPDVSTDPLRSSLEELCKWYDQCNHLFDPGNLPEELFQDIARYINYPLENVYNKESDE